MFGFPLGRLSGARLKVSFLFPLVVLGLMWRLQSTELGLLATGILFFSVLMHELAHLIVARSSGGEMDELTLWPLGGLAEPFGRGYFGDHIRTLLAGPAMNLLLAASCMLTLSVWEVLPLLNPLEGFSVPPDEAMVATACRMVFRINIVLFLANMIPATPFDMGVLLRTYMTTRFSEVESRDLMVRLGMVAGIIGILIGFVFDVSTLVGVSAFVLVLQIHESFRWYEVIKDTEEFSDYDVTELASSDEYSQSFEDDSFLSTNEPSQSDVLERWRERREHERLEREAQTREEEAAEVDGVLQKLHLHGRESLSTREIHLLNQVSNRLRNGQRH